MAHEKPGLEVQLKPSRLEDSIVGFDAHSLKKDLFFQGCVRGDQVPQSTAEKRGEAAIFALQKNARTFYATKDACQCRVCLLGEY